jgi:hypothetical protein
MVYAPYTCLIKASPSCSILSSRLTSYTMVITREILVVKFGQESKFIFIMQELCVRPLEGRAHHIEYMLIHLACMFTGWNVGPSPKVYYTWLRERWKTKRKLRYRLVIKRKLRASKMKWLHSQICSNKRWVSKVETSTHSLIKVS